ncbi:uncharacterized protein BXZ73DRAFT_74305 [Epithele typhae]|uniref:uncharacterized protein n=1 Tax=Epithele typhae TaxID=378194 RepID=UPI0020081A50|nr:uncharacterized protein BXZ73DRAFT_74305 [Epithele typhae]KAH9943325.1 hypothetical protein BXZ73DRAFT_74305 [Epithele typhae]
MPPSPTRTRRATNGEMPSFLRRPPKPDGVKTILAHANISGLSPAELQERFDHNARILAETSASSSAFIRQLEDQQAAIRERLSSAEVGVEGIRTRLEHTTIEDAPEAMSVDPRSPTSASPPSEPRPISAKEQVLARWNAKMAVQTGPARGMSADEAAQILRNTFKREQEHKQKVMDKKRRRGDILPGEQLTYAEKNARMLAFLNYKPTDSDMEDDDDDDDDDDDEDGQPTWFDEDDQDDGVKGQDIVEPDYEDMANIIRIDEARIPWAIPPEE